MIKKLLLPLLLLIPIQAHAGLKVFGPEFCTGYDAGACINFHYKEHLAQNWFGKDKYPAGKKAYEKCTSSGAATDGELAYCSMKFHYAEQTPKVRRQMCHHTVRQKYWETIHGAYAMQLYDAVWNCK